MDIKEFDLRVEELENNAKYWQNKFEQSQEEIKELKSWLKLAEQEIQESEPIIIVELDSFGGLMCSNTGQEFGNINELDPKSQKLIKALVKERDKLDEKREHLEWENEDLKEEVEELKDYLEDLRYKGY